MKIEDSQNNEFSPEVVETAKNILYKKTVAENAKGVSKSKARLSILEEAEQIEAAYRKKCPESFLTFQRGLTIASATGPRVFENCVAPFQTKCFEDIAPNLHAVRDGNMPAMRRFWIERTKKASKDADLAVIMVWLLCFPKKPLYMQVGAANREQAGIVKERMTHLLHWNPWLNDYMTIVQSEARSKAVLADGSPMAKLNILSSDVAGAHGGTPDVLIINELSHINKYEFAENLMDNADGVAQGLVIVATNAGIKGTKAEVWRNNALVSSEWSAHVLAEPAPWHSQKTLKDAKKRNTRSRYARLWEGVWQSGKGDAVDEGYIDIAFSKLQGPTLERIPGMTYVAGLDLGITHDHAAVFVTMIDERNQEISSALWKAWTPDPKTKEVNLMDVEEACLEIHKLYNVFRFEYDPFQAKLMAQRLIKAGVPMHEMTFSNTTNLTAMATCFIQVVEGRRISLYDDEEGRLRRDIGKFSIVEKSYGYKLEAVSDEYGHADVGTAMVITLPLAVDLMRGLSGLQEDDVLFDEEAETNEELTEEEVQELPDELRELYNSENQVAKQKGSKRLRLSQIEDPFADLV